MRSNAAVVDDVPPQRTPESTVCPVDELCKHPRLKSIFGTRSDKDYERVKASVMAQGIVDPIDLSPPDAQEYASRIVDGNLRHEIAVELGITHIPVRVVPNLRTFADQALHALAKTKRKELSESQRAAQEAAVGEIVSKMPSDWKRARGFVGWRRSEIVAAMVDTSERSVRRRKKIFQGESTTPAVKRAVDDGTLSVKAAYEIINEAESRFQPGSERVHEAIDEVLAELRRVGRRRQGPRPKLPDFDPLLDEARRKREAFWADMRARLCAYALSEVDPKVVRGLGGMIAHGILIDFLSDVHLDALEVRRRLRRLEGGIGVLPPPARSIHEINECLHVLRHYPIRRVEDLSAADVRKSYKLRARLLHPDVNKGAQAKEQFQELSRAYERVMDLLDGARTQPASRRKDRASPARGQG